MKQWLMDVHEAYKNKLLRNYKRSLSRICNSLCISFLLLKTVIMMPIFISSGSYTALLFLIFLTLLMMLRIIYMFVIISDTSAKRTANVAMMAIEVALLTIGFEYVPFIIFIFVIVFMLAGFPFLFRYVVQK